MKVLTLLVMVALWTEDASACTCRTLPFVTHLKMAETVFVGRCVSERYIREKLLREFVFEVERSWKAPQLGSITVASDAFGSACGYHFKLGERYIVWAGLLNVREGRKRLYTSFCSLSCPADSPEAVRQVKVLGDPLIWENMSYYPVELPFAAREHSRFASARDRIVAIALVTVTVAAVAAFGWYWVTRRVARVSARIMKDGRGKI